MTGKVRSEAVHWVNWRRRSWKQSFSLNEKKIVVFDLIFTNYVEQNAFNLLFSGTLSSSRPKSALFMSAAGSIIDVAVRM